MAVVRRKSSAMAEFLDARKKGRIIGPVERHVLNRKPDDRPTDVLHPSAMSKAEWCPRSAWFIVTGRHVEQEKPNLRRQLIFDEGHMIHAKWQKWLREMGVLYGMWECEICTHTWWGKSSATEEMHCFKCNGLFIKYREVPLVWESLTIAGHADGWVKGLGDDALIEIKSVGSGTIRYDAPQLFNQHGGDFEQIWKNIRRPFASHLRQGQLYLRILHETLDKGAAPNEIVFIYESKYNQDARDFVVPYDPKVTDGIVAKARLVTQHVALGEPPECPYELCNQCKGLEA